MGASLDSLFVQPRLVLTARKIDLYDAINLVAYAKFPLISARRGKDLVAGFIRRDQAGVAIAFLSENTEDELLDKYSREIASFRYPVGPSQYEPLLEKMVEADERWLPYFFHEHHQLIERRHRAALFADLHRELAGLVSTKEIALQITESERTYLMQGDAWMTAETCSAFLERHGVTPWWRNQENLESHARLERLLLSDGLAVSRPELSSGYDENQLPSYLFGEMLLKRARINSAHALAVQAQSVARPATFSEPESDFLNSHHKPPKLSDAGSSPELSPGGGNTRRSATDQPTQETRPWTSRQEDGQGDRESGRPAVTDEREQTQKAEASASKQNDIMLTRQGVASLLGLKSATSTENYVKRFPDFPKNHPITKRWSKNEIEAWLELHRNDLRN